MSDPSQPTALLVLGMHRSGTSALTRVLNLLGADVPVELMPADEYNKIGYWESKEVADLQDEILKSVGMKWDHLRRFPQSWYEKSEAKDYRLRAIEMLRRHFGNSRLFALKDPRISILMPFWLGVLKEMGVRPVPVIAVRHPLEVADSLARRNHFSNSKSLLLWLEYTLAAERETRGLSRCFVSYDELLTNWLTCVIRIASAAGVSWPRPIHEAKSEIDTVISGDLRHHRADPASLAAKVDIAWWIKRAYAAALAAAGGNDQGLATTLDEIGADFDTATMAFGPLLAESSADDPQLSRLKRDLAMKSRQYVLLSENFHALRQDHENVQTAFGEVIRRLCEKPSEHRKLGLADLVPVGIAQRAGDGSWSGNSGLPKFLVASPPLQGTIRVRAKIRSSVWTRACLYPDYGYGFIDAERIELEPIPPGETRIDRIIPLLKVASLIRIDPIQHSGEFSLMEFSLESLSPMRAAITSAARRFLGGVL